MGVDIEMTLGGALMISLAWSLPVVCIQNFALFLLDGVVDWNLEGTGLFGLGTENEFV